MAPVHSERWDNHSHWSAINKSQSAIAATLSSVTLPGCKRTFQLTRHSTAMFTYHSDVYQVAIGVITQAVLETDGLTRFGKTTTSRPLTSGGVPSVVVTAGRCYGLYRLQRLQCWRWRESKLKTAAVVNVVACFPSFTDQALRNSVISLGCCQRSSKVRSVGFIRHSNRWVQCEVLCYNPGRFQELFGWDSVNMN